VGTVPKEQSPYPEATVRYFRRVYLGGVAPNTPRFIRDPGAFDPQSMMPNLGVSQPHARDATAYLYTLR